jgi:hypothetical protein
VKPEFIDNRGERTLARALRALAVEPGCAGAPMDIATAFVNLGGFEVIAEVLESRPALRLLIGAEPASPLADPARNGSDPLGARTRERLADVEARLAEQRDALPFSARTAASVRRLERLLRRDSVAVRRYAERFLHGKAYLFRDQVVLAGSNNLTAAGLTSNLELALAHYQPGIVGEAQEWFDDLFARAEDYRERLIEILTARELRTWDPHDVYLRALLELYEDELDLLRDDERYTPGQPGGVTLADFQQHGFQRALRVIDRFDGVIVGDGVGLGKSFIGARLLRHFVKERGLQALVLVPAALRDSFWVRHLQKEGIAAQVLSYQELASERQLGGDKRRLLLAKDDYRFVLVDEAHAFRNPDTEQYRALARLMGGTRKKLCLLTATPVNNSVFDLYHQIMLFARHNARFAALGIPNLSSYFKGAVEAATNGGSQAAMFGLMDAISVRRSRQFIKKHYPDATIDGRPIRFPNPVLRTVRYDLDGFYPGLFARVERDMQALTLARYQPDNYRHDGVVDARAQSLASRLRTNLLKRFESSVGAFRLTTQTMIDAHEAFLEALDRREVLVPRGDAGGADDAADPARSVASGQPGRRPLREYRHRDLRRDVEADLERLRGFMAAVAGATVDDDPKLARLATLLSGGLGPEKVIVFSYYADTIGWIERAIESDPARFGGRPYVSVTGTSSESAGQRLEKVHQFCPETTVDDAGQAPVRSEEEKNLLLATDVLAEGQNLQQARYIVNYDMPWNPMRLVQRNGRIDRIGSPFETIELVNLFPEGQLDQLLKLYEILVRKIGQANVSVGMESPVFEETAAFEQNFGATAAVIRSIVDEDTGVLEESEAELDAFSGEELRMELRSALARDRLEELRAMPHGAGSGFLDERLPAGTRGVGFVTRVLLGSEPKPGPDDQRAWRYVDLSTSEVVADELTILKRLRCAHGTERDVPEGGDTTLYELWDRVRADLVEELNRRLDPAEAAPQVPASHAWAIGLLAQEVGALAGAGASSQAVQDAVDALSVDRGPVVQRMPNRPRQRLADGAISALAAAQEVLDVVSRQGLRPAEAKTAPTVEVTPERVRLICWQYVHRGG